jgi:hypothetical protein
MLEIKEFYGIASRRNNLSKIIEYSFNEGENKSSKVASLGCLNAICSWYTTKRSKSSPSKNLEEDGDINVGESDEEDTKDDVDENGVID